MDENNLKEKQMIRQIEKHDTAAWANISTMKPVSNVSIPDETQVINAKEYVDSNQK